MGANRELKKSIESYWAGKLDAAALLKHSKSLRLSHWKIQANVGISHIPSGDFSLYDQVLDTIVTFGAEPSSYVNIPTSELDSYFAMARGLQKDKIDLPAMEMKKWFDTNYHYIVPEFVEDQNFKLKLDNKFVTHFLEAKEAGIHTRPVLLGPVSFLLLGKPHKSQPEFSPISLLDKLVPCYVQLLEDLVNHGADWVQLDEPCLVLDLPLSLKKSYQSAYSTLGNIKVFTCDSR